MQNRTSSRPPCTTTCVSPPVMISHHAERSPTANGSTATHCSRGGELQQAQFGAMRELGDELGIKGHDAGGANVFAELEKRLWLGNQRSGHTPDKS